MDILKLLNQPGWDYRLTYRGVNIKAPTKEAANQLADIYSDVLLETAAKLKGRVQIGWRRCKNPFEFFGWMASEQPPTPAETAEQMLSFNDTVFTSQPRLPVPLLKRMVAAGESDHPMSITRHSDNRLIIINDPMEQMLQMPAVEATQRTVSDYWRAEDFAELHRRYREYGHFRWRYDAGINRNVWAILDTEFEKFEADGQWYGQNIILTEPEPIPFPEDVAIRV